MQFRTTLEKMKQKCSRADHCPYLGTCIFILLLIHYVASLQNFLFAVAHSGGARSRKQPAVRQHGGGGKGFNYKLRRCGFESPLSHFLAM